MKALGSNTDYSQYSYDEPNSILLETFPTPFKRTDVVGSIHIEVPEFTSLCPMTGQPDFATIIIDYVPDEKCIESKALKVYLMGYRNHGAFHESCVYQIANDLIKALDPKELTVKGEFTPRGGIPFHPTVAYKSKSTFGQLDLPGIVDC